MGMRFQPSQRPFFIDPPEIIIVSCSIFLQIAKEWEHHRILKDEYPTELDKLVNFNDISAEDHVFLKVTFEDFRSDRYYAIRRKSDYIHWNTEVQSQNEMLRSP